MERAKAKERERAKAVIEYMKNKSYGRKMMGSCIAMRGGMTVFYCSWYINKTEYAMEYEREGGSLLICLLPCSQ